MLLRDNELVTAPAMCTLTSTVGNVHSFVAGPEGVAFLDVLTPPYDER
jgi:hypothetical protein